MAPPVRTKAAQREATRALLIAEGRRRFARDGYAAVGLTEIVTALGITKGALYHHFGSKSGLFRAVLAQVQQEVADRVTAAASQHPDDAWQQLVAGCEAFLTASADPDLQRILLIDAPAVLGWNDWRAMDEAASGRLLADVLTRLTADQILPPAPVAPLTRLLSGAMNEAALWLAQSATPADLPATVEALHRLLAGLRAGPP